MVACSILGDRSQDAKHKRDAPPAPPDRAGSGHADEPRGDAVAGVDRCGVRRRRSAAGPDSGRQRRQPRLEIRNQSTRDLKLQSVQKLRKFACNANFHCFPTYYNFDFEGRPGSGDVLIPGAAQRFEVKWVFADEYGAEATYNIEGTNAQLQVTMKTSTFSNDSTCKILHVPIGSCTAGGLNIAYR